MVALTGNFHVVTSSGATNISAVIFFISHITQARYVRTFFEFRAGHTMLRAFHFNSVRVLIINFLTASPVLWRILLRLAVHQHSDLYAAIQRTSMSVSVGRAITDSRKSAKTALAVVIHECTLFAITERSARRWN
jgi:hypothetical protein